MSCAILDTNALMMPVECGVRVFEELDRVLGDPDLLVPAAVMAELEALAGTGGEAGEAASVGRDLAERCAVRETPAEYADDAVLELARAESERGGRETYAVTNDRELRERLRGKGVPVICLRGQDKLAIN